jgi:hypothetical protein
MDQIKVDLLFTRTQDAMASLRAAVFFLEEKLVGHLNEGIVQCVAYLRRQMRVLIKEWSLRGANSQELLVPESMSVLSKLFSVGAGTDGATISFVRVTSGVAEDCTDLHHASHVLPEISTHPLEFLPIDKSYTGGPIRLPEKPTRGFIALFQVLSLHPDLLSSVSPPLTSVTCCSAEDAVGASTTFTLTERLGSGGSSDVYKGCGPEGEMVVVKAPRYTTAPLVTQFLAEQECLSALAVHDTVDARGIEDVPLLPRLVPGAMRFIVEREAHPRPEGSAHWPVLVFTGPLDAVPLLHALATPKYRNLAARVDLANRVARRLLDTAKVCRACPCDDCDSVCPCIPRHTFRCVDVSGVRAQLVHSEGWVNCDVRPANIVLKDGVPVQVRAPLCHKIVGVSSLGKTCETCQCLSCALVSRVLVCNRWTGASRCAG